MRNSDCLLHTKCNLLVITTFYSQYVKELFQSWDWRADDKIMNLQAFRLTCYRLSKELLSWPIFETGVQMYEAFLILQKHFSDFHFFNNLPET